MKWFRLDKSNIYQAGLFFYPFVCVLIIGFFLIPFTLEYLKEIVAFGFLTALFYGLFLLLGKRFKIWVFFLFIIILSLLAFVKLAFYYLYSVKPSASALFVIFETNLNETKEYLGQYFSFPIIVLGALLLGPLLLVIAYFLRRPNAPLFNPLKNLGILKRLGLFVLVAVCGYVIHWKFSQENLLLKSYYSLQEYKEFQELIKGTIAKPTSNYFEGVSKDSSATETIVVIIGESTSHWHMQLYNYSRETNPKLKEIENELFVFENVISPHVHTILSLEKTLTFASFKDPTPRKNASIIQMANEAGFETYWISNQQPIGVYESLSTMIANAAKNKYFVATEGYKYTIHDEALLPVFENILQEPAKKKVVFLHLIGTHVSYRKRYPKEFDFFKEPIKPMLSKEANEYINHYDNAIRYNDSIVWEVIEELKQREGERAMVYFSDHGDDVFDVGDKVGHNEYKATPPMYEVPFILWMSPNHSLRKMLSEKKDTITKRPYHLEDFPYTFANLSGISFRKYNPSRSIFSDQYYPRKRIVKDSIDYDKK